MKDIRAVGNKIKCICENKGVSTKELSDLLECSVLDVQMSLLGRKIFSYQQLEKIAQKLCVSIDEIINVKTDNYYMYGMDCMNDFTKSENREQILDLIYDYLDVYDSVN